MHKLALALNAGLLLGLTAAVPNPQNGPVDCSSMPVPAPEISEVEAEAAIEPVQEAEVEVQVQIETEVDVGCGGGNVLILSIPLPDFFLPQSTTPVEPDSVPSPSVAPSVDVETFDSEDEPSISSPGCGMPEEPATVQPETTQPATVQPDSVPSASVQPATDDESDCEDSESLPLPEEPATVQPDSVPSASVQPAPEDESDCEDSDSMPLPEEPATVQPDSIPSASVQPATDDESDCEDSEEPASVQPSKRQPAELFLDALDRIPDEGADALSADDSFDICMITCRDVADCSHCLSYLPGATHLVREEESTGTYVMDQDQEEDEIFTTVEATIEGVSCYRGCQVAYGGVKVFRECMDECQRLIMEKVQEDAMPNRDIDFDDMPEEEDDDNEFSDDEEVNYDSDGDETEDPALDDLILLSETIETESSAASNGNAVTMMALASASLGLLLV